MKTLIFTTFFAALFFGYLVLVYLFITHGPCASAIEAACDFSVKGENVRLL